MKGFYDLPKYIQWIIAIILLIVGMGTMTPIIIQPYGLLALPILSPLFNLITVPVFRLMGFYKYLNPYVLSSVQTDKHYDLHNVFTFDYLVNFKWADRGKKAQKTLLAHCFKALLTIIDRIESGQLSESVNVVGHSYFFSDRTADSPIFWVVNSSLQFIELTYLYSFSQGKWAIPKFWKVKKAEIVGSDLVKKKEFLEGLVSRLENN